MKLINRLISIATAIPLLVFSLVAPANAAVTNWNQSASIVPSSTTDFSSESFKQSLRDLQNIGANSVTLIIPYYQSSIHSTSMFPGYNTPTDTSLVDAITYAHSLGMNVTLMMHLEAQDTNWRANINPSDRAGWFANYENVLLHYGNIAQQNGVQAFIIGAELINMASDFANPTNSSYWRPMIDRIRNIYSGTVSYSAQRGYGATNDWYNEMDNIGFWDKLDYLGISGYYELDNNTTEPTATGVLNSWHSIESNYLSPLQQKYGKPLQFTEIGYRSADGTNQAPWDWGRGGSYDPDDQALLYDQLFTFWNDIGYFNGVHLWQWQSDPNAGGTGDTTYTPQNKPAEEVIENWFSNGSTTTPSPTPTSVPDQFTVSGEKLDTALQITVASNSSVNNAIVDVEIYNSAGHRVHQQYFENQNLSSTPSSYTVNWLPNTNDTYTVRLGIFSSGWDNLYYWDHELLTFELTPNPTSTPTGSPVPTTSPSPTATPIESEVEVWWPTDNGSISGTQPFKAIAKYLAIEEYEMYWTVDNGQRNKMNSSHEDYPHKEVWVDVSGWTWRDTGPYTIKFIAVLPDGKEYAQEIQIYVSR